MFALKNFSRMAFRANRLPYKYTYRSFAAPGGLNLQGLANAMSQTATGELGNRKINTQTLCDLIGSRYYPHNEEIEMNEDKMVKCFDENDTMLGEMTLREAL